jgi:serine protease Do
MNITKLKLWSVLSIVLIGVIVGIIFASNFNWTPKGFASKTSEPLTIGSQEDPSESVLNLQNTSKAFTAVCKEILPTVVSISTSKMIKRSSKSNDPFGPLLREWFGKDFEFNEPETQKLQGLGSGVIVNGEGYILTNNHVIENADDIKVKLYDNRQFDAKLIGTDPLTEVAVIKIEGEKLPVARLGDSDMLEVGEWVLAIGNPLALNSTVTAGIVSAKGRDIGIIRGSNYERTKGSYAIENFIQTDAAINPGNSGGALVNLHAEVVGINTAIATGTGYYAGYGFAIPIKLAKKIMNDLMKQGYVTRAWLGIAMKDVNERIAERYNMDRPKGVLIAQVIEDSPAEKAGLKSLDIILSIDGKEMNHSNEIQSTIAYKNPNDVVELKILRDSKEKKVKVKLGKRDTGKISSSSKEEDIPELGLKVQELSVELKSRLKDYQNEKGVVVVSVESYSVAAEGGIQRGDLIVKIEDYRISSVSDYHKALRKFEKGKVVIFYLKREKDELHAFVKLPDK